MKIIAIAHEREDATPEQFMPLLKAESLRVWELMQADILREIYFRQDSHSAVLILECTNADEAKKVLDTLPLAKSSIITFEVIPLVPYDGLSILFEDI
jgi:hypothetical protein